MQEEVIRQNHEQRGGIQKLPLARDARRCVVREGKSRQQQPCDKGWAPKYWFAPASNNATNSIARR